MTFIKNAWIQNRETIFFLLTGTIKIVAYILVIFLHAVLVRHLPSFAVILFIVALYYADYFRDEAKVSDWTLNKYDDALKQHEDQNSKGVHPKMRVLATIIVLDFLGMEEPGVHLFLTIGPKFENRRIYYSFDECPNGAIAIEVEYDKQCVPIVQGVVTTPKLDNSDQSEVSEGPKLQLLLGGLDEDKNSD